MRMIIVVVVVSLCCDVARADKPLKTDIARSQFELGQKLYKTADYPGALDAFVKAYKLKPMPRMLFNIARCHEVMVQRKEAIKYYLLYLEKLPQAPNKDVVELRIVNLTMQENTASSRPARAKKSKGDAPRIPSALLVDAPRKRAQTWRSTVGVVGLSVGGASMIAGVIFGAMAKSRADEFKIGVDDKASYAYLRATDKDGQRFETLQIATLAAGGAILAGGLAMLLWDRLRGRGSAERPIISPFAGDKTLGLTGRISF